MAADLRPVTPDTVAALAEETRPRIETVGLTAYYGAHAGVKDVSLRFSPHHVHALIGPSGCGKSTFLRSLNRLNGMIRHPKAAMSQSFPPIHLAHR